ncbi:MAG TPA: hypothetical protein VND89_12005 [Acidimicrobiales bacterium]|nr:hypothetical protein [Acidimicrobiales bacterium]
MTYRSAFFAAGRLLPETLRSLDALHLATALEIGDDLEGVVVCDDRLIEGARRFDYGEIAAVKNPPAVISARS